MPNISLDEWLASRAAWHDANRLPASDSRIVAYSKKTNELTPTMHYQAYGLVFCCDDA
jgi:hypothetical protein